MVLSAPPVTYGTTGLSVGAVRERPEIMRFSFEGSGLLPFITHYQLPTLFG